jgi:hypothetical protein
MPLTLIIGRYTNRVSIINFVPELFLVQMEGRKTVENIRIAPKSKQM